jgi:hypothetical protein
MLASAAMVKHRKIVLSVRLSTVPKEITHQRGKAEAFDVSGAEFVRPARNSIQNVLH